MKEQKRITFEKKKKREKSAAASTPETAIQPPPIFLRNFDPRTRFHFEWHPPQTPSCD